MAVIRKTVFHLFLILFFCILFSPDKAPAEEHETVRNGEDQIGEKKSSSFWDTPLEILEEFQAGFSRRIHNTADWIDSFFGEDRIYDESKGGAARISLSSTLEEGGEITYKPRLKVKIPLPRTQDKFKILIFGEEESDLPAEEKKEDDLKKAVSSRDDYANYAAVRYVPKKNRRRSLNSDIGIRLHTPIDYFVKVRGRISFFPGKWQIRFTETIFWYESKKFGEKTQFDLERKVSDSLFFRSTSDGTWYDTSDDLLLNQTFSLYQQLTGRNAISYQTGIHGIRHNSHITTTAYSLRFRFRRNFHKNWLFYEITPGALWPREEDYDFSPYLTFKIEMLFGRI